MIYIYICVNSCFVDGMQYATVWVWLKSFSLITIFMQFAFFIRSDALHETVLITATSLLLRFTALFCVYNKLLLDH